MPVAPALGIPRPNGKPPSRRSGACRSPHYTHDDAPWLGSAGARQHSRIGFLPRRPGKLLTSTRLADDRMGRDEQALARRHHRWQEMQAASALARLADPRRRAGTSREQTGTAPSPRFARAALPWHLRPSNDSFRRTAMPDAVIVSTARHLSAGPTAAPSTTRTARRLRRPCLCRGWVSAPRSILRGRGRAHGLRLPEGATGGNIPPARSPSAPACR